MYLTQNEKESLFVVVAAWLAKERLAKGMKLSFPDAVALITFEVMEMARTGQYSVSDLQIYGRDILSEEDVMEGVPALISKVNVQATFPDGTKLVVIYPSFHSPQFPKSAEEIGQQYP
ncbi:urease subunit gamma [Bacillus sp. FJAT-27231]|uniref:urease subunit gamma n=1 Tax=Bacillus sp. FJAT-27231 TaxID=1679168 RepID=UPI0009E23981|nr:urease subunit gamma [Bacillus sp. FJAT-27231]